MLRRTSYAALGLALAAGCSWCSTPAGPSGATAADAGADGEAGDAAPADGGDGDAVHAGEDVYGIDLDDGTFLTDKKIWTPVPDNGGCGLFVASVLPDPFPKRTWAACGPGCLESVAWDGVPGSASGSVPVGGTTAGERGGELFLRVNHHTKPVGGVMVVSRVADGATVAALEIRNGKCGYQGWANDATLMFPVFGDAPTKGDLMRRGGVLSSEQPGATVAWGKWLPFPGPQGSFFSWDDGWGIGAGSALWATTSLSDTKLTPIDPKTSPFEVSGRGKLVIWPAGDAVKSYTQTGGLKYLWTAPKGYMASAALSDSKLVWIVVDGPKFTSEYRFESARLYHSPLATDPGSLVVTEGPLLEPSTSAFFELRTGGDFAASEGCYAWSPTEGVCKIFVVQLSTGKVWKIPPRPGKGYHDVLAVSAKEVLVTEYDEPGTPSEGQQIRRFLRFSTAELDALEKAW